MERIQKNVKKIFRNWYDNTYKIGKHAFISRMIRDMNELEDIIGHKLSY